MTDLFLVVDLNFYSSFYLICFLTVLFIELYLAIDEDTVLGLTDQLFSMI